MQPGQEQKANLREARAWILRCRGWSQTRIALEMGLSQGAVCKMLDRIEKRELKRLSAAVEQLKVLHTGQLDHVIEESLEAWHRSKLPRKRAARKVAGSGSGGGPDDDQGGGTDEVQTTEVIERDGDPAHLYCAMNALDRQRSLWGLDVAPALQEPAASVAELARDLLARGHAYEDRRQHEKPEQEPGPETAAPGDPGGDVRPDRGGAGSMPEGPESVQRNDPVP